MDTPEDSKRKEFIKLEQRISHLADIAYKAMEQEYISARTRLNSIAPDWKRNVDEHYDGTVYETKNAETPQEAPRIDPHHWANMKQYMIGIIYSVLDPPKITGRVAPTFEDKLKEAPTGMRYHNDTEVRVMLAGIKAAAAAYHSPSTTELG